MPRWPRRQQRRGATRRRILATRPDADLVRRIESSQGTLTDRFAFCQAMPLDEFLAAAEALRPSGYRPVRFRPYADGSNVRVAAVWTRDRRNWRVASGLAAEDLRRLDESVRRGFHRVGDGAADSPETANREAPYTAASMYVPVDVAGYVAISDDGKLTDRYAALWAEKTGSDVGRLYAGALESELAELHESPEFVKLTPRCLQSMRGADGRRRHSGVWGEPVSATVTARGIGDHLEDNSVAPAVTARGIHDLLEDSFRRELMRRSDQLLVDVAVSESGSMPTPRMRAIAARERAQQTLKTKPDDVQALLDRAMASFRMQEYQHALDDLQLVISKAPEAASAQEYRIITPGTARQKVRGVDRAGFVPEFQCPG